MEITGQEEEEEEWEEEYVYIDLVGMVDPEKLNLCNKENTSILGVDGSDMTVLKLGGYVFAGTYEEPIGTMVFFEEQQQQGSTKQTNKQPVLKYNCHTTKVLKASRAFLKQKYEEEEGEEKEQAVPGANKAAEKTNIGIV